jgi:DNA polymerase I
MNCEHCPLNGRPRIAGGEGNPETAEIILIGEAPGATEIAQDRPFVGQSGKLLRQTLKELGVEEGEAYFTNACLCRPEGNATPLPAAVAACAERLEDEIATCRNRRVIAPLGATALHTLFPGSKVSITSAHGVPVWSKKYSCYIVPTFHPAAVLRLPSMFRDFGDDLDFAINHVPEEEVEGVEVPHVDVVTDGTVEDAILTRLRACRYVVCDIETTGLNPRHDRILSVMVMGDRDNAYVFPEELMLHSPETRAFFEDPEILWVGHNASQFDAEFLLQRYGINWYPKFDTLLAHYCTDERQGGHGLKVLAQKMFFAKEYGAEMKAHMRDNTLDKVPLENLWTYQALDCLYTFMLVPIFEKQMSAEGVRRVHDDLLIPMAHTFRDVELRGIRVDEPYLEVLQKTLGDDLDLKRAALCGEASDVGLSGFNPNSPKQVGELLYDKMHLDGRADRSTNRTSLAALHSDTAQRILEYRMSSKLLGTYAKGLTKHIDTDGRIHADFLLFGTQTGRLSCQNPNLHNIPSLMRGPEIKKAFCSSSPEWCIMEADFSQLELRVAAYLSRDQKLIQTYREGQDFHRVVAAEIFDVPPEQVTKQQRHIAKYVDFGILYGRGAKSLAEGWSAGQDLESDALTKEAWTVSMAQGFIDRMMAQFPQLDEWIRNQHREVLREHFVATPFGRRRRFPFISHENAAEVQRQAVNFPIQSVASDICQLGLIKLNKWLDPAKAFIISTVHDSILMEVRKDAIGEVALIVHQVMEEFPPQLDGTILPLKVDIAIGPSWGSIEELK